MKCRLIAYYRVSTSKQGQSGLGLDAQRAAVAAHAKHTGCTIVGEYLEVESGKRADRPELANAMAHAKRVGATLVIAKLDRLARNVHFLSGLMESGVEFVACDNPSANRLTLHILAAVAEDEARRISERTRAALAAAKERGTQLGGRREGQHLLTSENRSKGGTRAAATKRQHARDAYADLLPMMRQLRSEGLPFQAIADRLTEAGHTTRNGSRFQGVQVMRALNRS